MLWMARSLLVLILSGMTFIAVQPEYNFAHFIPHDWLDALGLSYATQLWLEQNADKALHLVGAFVLTLLLALSLKSKTFSATTISLMLVVGLCVVAEITQHFIGRGFSVQDLLLGFLGAFLAYFMVRRWLNKT